MLSSYFPQTNSLRLNISKFRSRSKALYIGGNLEKLLILHIYFLRKLYSTVIITLPFLNLCMALINVGIKDTFFEFIPYFSICVKKIFLQCPFTKPPNHPERIEELFQSQSTQYYLYDSRCRASKSQYY